MTILTWIVAMTMSPMISKKTETGFVGYSSAKILPLHLCLLSAASVYSRVSLNGSLACVSVLAIPQFQF